MKLNHYSFHIATIGVNVIICPDKVDVPLPFLTAN
jgi:hypothetical protein